VLLPNGSSLEKFGSFSSREQTLHWSYRSLDQFDRLRRVLAALQVVCNLLGVQRPLVCDPEPLRRQHNPLVASFSDDALHVCHGFGEEMLPAAGHQHLGPRVEEVRLYLGTKPEPVSPARSPLFRPSPSPARPEGQWARAGTARGCRPCLGRTLGPQAGTARPAK